MLGRESLSCVPKTDPLFDGDLPGRDTLPQLAHSGSPHPQFGRCPPVHNRDHTRRDQEDGQRVHHYVAEMKKHLQK